MKSIALFNNKGGVGKTTLVYHLSWMYSVIGKKVLAVDLDPQANVTSMFLDDEQLSLLVEPNTPNQESATIFQSFSPLISGVGDIKPSRLYSISENLWLIPGDLELSAVEDELSYTWTDCSDGKERAFRVMSAIWRLIESAVNECSADIVLIDVGPNLGALNRASLICADNVVVPLAPDLYSLQGLRNLGPALRRWRADWQDRLRKANSSWHLSLPQARMLPVGYVVLQHAVRADRPVKAYDRWMNRIPRTYREYVLDEPSSTDIQVGSDEHCLALLKNYRSLMPLAQEARKPMFLLKPADGAIGGHALAVQDCYRDFERLVSKIDANTK